MANPLRDLYDAFWDMLEARSEFTTLFPNGTVHQVRYNSDNDNAPDADEDAVPPAHYPRCRIVATAGGGFGNAPALLKRSSSGSVLPVRLRIEVCTGTMQQGVLLDAIWSIFRAMADYEAELRAKLTWNSKGIVVFTDIEEIAATDQNQERNRGTKQWIGVLQVLVVLSFQTTDLQGTGT